VGGIRLTQLGSNVPYSNVNQINETNHRNQINRKLIILDNVPFETFRFTPNSLHFMLDVKTDSC